MKKLLLICVTAFPVLLAAQSNTVWSVVDTNAVPTAWVGQVAPVVVVQNQPVEVVENYAGELEWASAGVGLGVAFGILSLTGFAFRGGLFLGRRNSSWGGGE